MTFHRTLNLLSILALLMAAPLIAQPKPAPKVEPKAKPVPEKGAKWEPPQRIERRTEPVRAEQQKGDKWASGQKKEGFNKAAKGQDRDGQRRTDREPAKVEATAAQKRDKWASGQQKDGFNKAARGETRTDGGSGGTGTHGKTGGTAPPPGPAPKP